MTAPRREQEKTGGPADVRLLDLIVGSVSDLTLVSLDDEGRVTSWNGAAERLTGLAPAAALGRPLPELFRAGTGDGERVAAALEEARSRRVGVEGWLRRPDGTRLLAEAVLVPLHGAMDGRRGYACVLRDRTALRGLEQKVATLGRRLDEIQQLAHLGSWEWDVRADRVFWSQELYRIYGLDPDTFGASFEAFLSCVHPEDRAETQRQIENALATASPFDFEERIIRPDGSTRLLRSQGEVVVDASGEPARLVGVCLDVTERRAAEQRAGETIREQARRAAAEEEARRLGFLAGASRILASSLDYEATLQTVARLAVPLFADWCVVDLADGDGGLRRVAVQHRDPARIALVRRLASFDPADAATARGIYAAFRTGEPEFLPEISPRVLATLASGPEHMAVLEELGPVSAILAPLSTRAGTLGTLSLVYAESGRRYGEADVPLAEDLARRAAVAIEHARLVRALAAKTEEAEHARLGAEQANQAKSRFLAQMSHELRTPLNAIAGYTELLAIGVHGEVNARQQHALERIQRNQRHLLSLIDDLLTFARIEAGRIRIILAPVPLDMVFRELEPLVAPQIHAKGLQYRSVDQCDLWVRADRERLDQVLLNIVMNAVKFTDRGGQIDVSCTDEDDTVQIHIEDTGRGISPEHLGSIFEPFEQAETQTTPGGEGVGLGLAIGRELTRAMGGRLSVRSSLGQGSVFTVTLPRATTPHA